MPLKDYFMGAGAALTPPTKEELEEARERFMEQLPDVKAWWGRITGADYGCEPSSVVYGDYSELERRVISSYRPEEIMSLPKPLRYFAAYSPGVFPSLSAGVGYGGAPTVGTVTARPASSVLTSWPTEQSGSSSPGVRSLRERFLTTVAGCAVAVTPRI